MLKPPVRGELRQTKQTQRKQNNKPQSFGEATTVTKLVISNNINTPVTNL